MPNKSQPKLKDIIQKVKEPKPDPVVVEPKPKTITAIEPLNTAASQTDIVRKLNELINAKS